MRGGVRRYAAQVSLQIDAATAEKSRFQIETSSKGRYFKAGAGIVQSSLAGSPGRSELS